jgi:hypothetical protein
MLIEHSETVKQDECQPDPGDLGANDGIVRDEVLEHILECDTCLDVLADLLIPTELCVERCAAFRKLVSPLVKVMAAGGSFLFE